MYRLFYTGTPPDTTEISYSKHCVMFFLIMLHNKVENYIT